MWYPSYVKSKRKKRNGWTERDLFPKQKETHRHRKQTYGYQKERLTGRDKIGGWD